MDMKKPLYEKDCPKCGGPMRWKNIEEPRCESCDGVSVQPVARTVIDRLREYAGKDRNQVVNPNITAREAIQIADYLVELEKELNATTKTDLLLNHRCEVGLYGYSYDGPEKCRAYTYDYQPNNQVATCLGWAADLAVADSAGDTIDRGLCLLRRLQEEGFGVFQMGRVK